MSYLVLNLLGKECSLKYFKKPPSKKWFRKKQNPMLCVVCPANIFPLLLLSWYKVVLGLASLSFDVGYFAWPTNKWGIATPPSIQGRCSSKTLWFWRGIERKERDRKIYSVYTLKNCGFLPLLCMQNKLWQLVVCTLSMIPF